MHLCHLWRLWTRLNIPHLIKFSQACLCLHHGLADCHSQQLGPVRKTCPHTEDSTFPLLTVTLTLRTAMYRFICHSLLHSCLTSYRIHYSAQTPLTAPVTLHHSAHFPLIATPDFRPPDVLRMFFDFSNHCPNFRWNQLSSWSSWILVHYVGTCKITFCSIGQNQSRGHSSRRKQCPRNQRCGRH